MPKTIAAHTLCHGSANLMKDGAHQSYANNHSTTVILTMIQLRLMRKNLWLSFRNSCDTKTSRRR